jgi:hypothetical protein
MCSKLGVVGLSVQPGTMGVALTVIGGPGETVAIAFGFARVGGGGSSDGELAAAGGTGVLESSARRRAVASAGLGGPLAQRRGG